MNKYDHILAKSGNGKISLSQHLIETAIVAVKAAEQWNLDAKIAEEGALIHDIGKASSIFQEIIRGRRFNRPFRHEIASLFFLSLFKEEHHAAIIEMVIGHHKSIYDDGRKMGILDLDDYYEDLFQYHAADFKGWSIDALGILHKLRINIHDVTLEEARNNFNKTLEYCESTSYGWSRWKGLLIGADHYSSAIPGAVEESIKKSFHKPDLRYYDKLYSEEYPLSLIEAENKKLHTLLQAPTGSGKTNFLLRRCQGRVFYVLPYQASINAMYHRIKNDVGTTTDDIRLLHSTSRILLKNGRIEEKVLQDKIGASIKILTPHQIASIVFGIKGYESIIMDIKGCDVILDEIHTYSDITQAIVLKIIEILDSLGCSIHIGTATMPSVLYNKIIEILGEENVYQVSLPNEVLTGYDRHRVKKLKNTDEIWNIVQEAVQDNQKILIVCNQVGRSQHIFETVCDLFPNYPAMLIHSRFKRLDRQKLEVKLTGKYNESEGGCIVVSTQVVEVSLDISFDTMITEAAPIDALIQRFGRINRKRKWGDTGIKPVCILPPLNDKQAARPYSLEILVSSFNALPDDEILHEREIQSLLDKVYPEIQFLNIDLSTVFENDKWKLKKLWHIPKSALLEILDIDSATCITESDQDKYLNASLKDDRIILEIPINFNSICWKNLYRLEKGTCPFVIPDQAYSDTSGLLLNKAKPENYASKFL